MAFAPVSLVQLEATFCKVIDDRAHQEDVSFREADGVRFLCPQCYREAGSSVGVHSVICWSPKVRPDRTPGPGRWELRGTGIGDLSLVAGSSSVALTGGGCAAHFYVRNGQAVDANP